MKKLIVLLLLAVSLTVYSQDKGAITSGKVYNLDSMYKAKPKSEADLIRNCKPTNNMAIYKGQNHVVYESNERKLFIVIKTKNKDSYYRRYIDPIK